MFGKTFALASLASIASAHMLMNNPVPFGKSDLSNGPLDASGSDFPCKQRPGVYDAQGASNVYEQGSKQTLSFTGQAVHGGGSCQISITTDAEPDKNSVWKVIKSIEGGCPAKEQTGNMGDDANAEDPYTYDYTIPAELAAGKYTIAWTWYNKVGNREMYMNCAPLEVTGSGGSKDHLDSLPDMFVANIGNDCVVPADKDLQFFNPGEDVDKFNGATEAFATANGAGCKSTAGGAPAPTGGNDSPAPTEAQPTEAQPTEAQPTSAPEATKSIPGGVFITVSQPAASQPVATEPAATQAPPATTAAPDNGSGSGDGSGDGSGSGEGSGDGSQSPGGGSEAPSGGFSAGTACTNEGEWNCIGGSSFQRCASGAWTAAQALSEGVTCTPGQATDIALAVKRGKRAMRRALRVRV